MKPRTDASTRGRVYRALQRYPQGASVALVASSAAITLAKALDALHDLRDAGQASVALCGTNPDIWRLVKDRWAVS